MMKLYQDLDKPKESTFPARLAGLMIGVGIVLRIAQYASNRSLWFDEALLALNITNRSFIELFQPLAYNQGAPIGFLLIQKFLTQFFGNYDYILRLFPLAAGIVAIFAFYMVARSFLQNMGALVSIGLFTILPRLIYYASEAKQYSSDTLASLLLVYLAVRTLEGKERPKQVIILMVAGIGAMWISHPALFIFIGVGSVLTIDVLSRHERNQYPWLGVLFLGWGINLAILYFVSIRWLAANPALTAYWRDAFMPLPPWRNPAWLYNAFLGMFRNPVGLEDQATAITGMAFFLLGALSLFLSRWQYAVLLTVPVLAALLASGLEKYPFSDRMLLFIAPIVLLLVGEGIERIGAVFKKLNPWIAYGVCVLAIIYMFITPTKQAVQNLLSPNMGEDIKPVMAYIQQQRIVTDPIYIYYGAVPAFSFYAPRYGFEQKDIVTGSMSRQDPTKYIEELDSLRSNRQVWFIFAHNCYWCAVNEEVFFLEHLNSIGSRTDEIQATGASAYSYRLIP